MKKTIKLILSASLICLAAWYFLGMAGGGEADPAAGVLTPSQSGDAYAFLFEVLAIVLIIAAVGHYAAAKLKQSPVLGEIAMGIIVGTLLYQLGWPTMTIIRHYEQVHQVSCTALTASVCFSDATSNVLKEAGLPEKDAQQLAKVLLRKDVAQSYLTVNALQLFSSLGVILLLFLVGLECNVKEMRAVGRWALGVALIGIVGIFLLSYLALSIFFLKGGNPLIPVFLAAALTATSIGITARVFKDLKRMRLREAKVVLGAAVMDDVLGLIILAVVTGVAIKGAVDLSTVAGIFLKALIFLVGVFLLGAILVPRLVTLFAALSRKNVRIIFPFALLMLLAWLADWFGLATIIGAFAAGIIIEEDYFPGGGARPDGGINYCSHPGALRAHFFRSHRPPVGHHRFGQPPGPPHEPGAGGNHYHLQAGLGPAGEKRGQPSGSGRGHAPPGRGVPHLRQPGQVPGLAQRQPVFRHHHCHVAHHLYHPAALEMGH